MGNDGVGSGPVRATLKSLDILASVREDGPATVTELTDRLEYSKSTIHRHVTTLTEEGYLVEGDEGYRIGLLYLDYGIHARNRNPLYSVVDSKLDEIAAELGEKVWCVTEEDGYGVFLKSSSGKHAVKTYTRVGYRIPLHAFAGGKAILAFMDENRVEAIIERRGLSPFTDDTITSRAELFEQFEQVRDQGVAFNYEEGIEGIHAVAAPVLDRNDQPRGSISVAGPANRVKGTYMTQEIPELLLGFVNELEVRLAYE